MKLTRQQLLLGLLVVIGVVRAGDYLVTSMIQGPLRQLRGENNELQEEVKKREALLAEARTAGRKIASWQQKSLPADTENARSLYRNWLLETVRSAKLQNATVDSGSVANRRGLYRSMPFNIQARGGIHEITTALFHFEKSNQLHRVVSLRLTPVAATGQFDLAMGVEALMVPGTSRTSLNPGESKLLASADLRDYDIIARDNIFGIGINHQNPMQMTILSAVTYRDGVPTAWITEQIDGRVHKLAAGAAFETTALAGRIVTVEEKSVVIETGGDQLTMTLGQSFAEALATPGS